MTKLSRLSSPLIQNATRQFPRLNSLAKQSNNFQVRCHATEPIRSTGRWKKWIGGVSSGVIAGSILYDGLNGFEYCGGAGRFLRSVKIAAQISTDYAWNLRKVTEGTEDYEKVITFGVILPEWFSLEILFWR